jgi:altronate hydrolase
LRIDDNKVLKIHPDDNVLVALADLRSGDLVRFDGRNFTMHSDVPAKHKFSITELAVGDHVIMYGVVVGKAVKPIPAGEAITVLNTRHEAAPVSGRSKAASWTPPDVSRWRERAFQGYRRPDGQVGTRNHWIVVPLVFCENRNIDVMRQAFVEELGFAAPPRYRRLVAQLLKAHREGKDARSAEVEEISQINPSSAFANVNGIKFLTHQGGCGGTREDARALCGLLAGYIHNPNVAGATILSLGCQNAQVDVLREELQKRGETSGKPVLVFDQQRAGTENQLLTQAIRETFFGLVEANKVTRSPAPLQALTVGLKCGGSDGFSGISANPTLGQVADKLAALGAKTILSEFPELCGVEQELVDRCLDDESAARFLALMSAYSSRAKAIGSSFDMNPSPGNIKDGLITDAMKSAGAARKGGSSPIAAVLDFPEYATKSGLNLLCTPGNDVESVTAQVGSGANLVLFTTGLGTPTGNPVTPVMKIATNTALVTRMSDIIDFDCGPVIDGNATPEEMSKELLELMLRVSSGELKTKSELLDQDDFIPWKRGVSL